jgi:hypothetical protein
VSNPIFPNADGKANLFLDEKDKSVLYVNYWISKRQTVPAGTIIREVTITVNCAGVPNPPVIVVHPASTQPQYFYYQPVPNPSPLTGTTWFALSSRLEILNAAGAVQYYLVNRYDRDAKYVLELDNREFIGYKSASLDFAALTIPFKFRKGFTENGKKVDADVSASFNIGVYGGYKLTHYRIINKGGTYIQRSSAALRVGPFLNFSAISIDSISTTVGKVPKTKDQKSTIGVLSTGFGVMGDLKGVQLGVYVGWDFGMGSEAVNWNYHKRFWWGIGVGYKITDLFAQK